MTVAKAKRVCFPFVGDTIGGSHLSALLLIEALDRRFFEPVIAVHERGPLADYLAARDIPYILAPEVTYAVTGRMLTRLWAMVRCSQRLVPFLKSEEIDIIHTNDVRMHMTWGLSARRAGVKFVWHQRTRMSLGRAAYFGLLANALFVISDYSWGGYGSVLKRKARKLPNPVSLENLNIDRGNARDRLLDELATPTDVKVLAFVGNLRDQKRPQIFIEAAARLRDHYGENIRCLIFGEERMPAAAQMRSLIADLDLQAVCRFMGSRFPIEPWLAGCDLVMTPAVNEGFGRVLIEAMIVGTPVIASNDAGHKEIIEDGITGRLVEPDNPAAFAFAAIELLDHPLKAADMAAAAQIPVIERHAPERHAEAMQSCYRGFFEKA